MHIGSRRLFCDDKASSRPAVDERRGVAPGELLRRPRIATSTLRRPTDISLACGAPLERALNLIGATFLLDQGASMH